MAQHDAILDIIGTWARDLHLPLLDSLPDDVIESVKNGAKVPLKSLLEG